MKHNYSKLDKFIKIIFMLLINIIVYNMIFSNNQTNFSSVYFIICIILLGLLTLILLMDTAVNISSKIKVSIAHRNQYSYKADIVVFIVLSLYFVLNTYQILSIVGIIIQILVLLFIILFARRFNSYFKGIISNWLDIIKVGLLIFILITITTAIFDESISFASGYEYLFYVLIYSVVISIILVFKNVKECLVNNQLKNLTFSVVLFFILFLFHIFLLNAFLLKIDSNNFLLHGEFNTLSNFQIFYYSVINITSVGFGDITPNSIDSQVISIGASVGGYLIFSSLIGLVLSITYNNEYKKMSNNK